MAMKSQSLNQFEFHHRLADSRGVSLVWFTAPQCGACRVLEQIVTEHGERLGIDNLYRVDAEREMALTREFEVFHLPAMFLYRDGCFHSPLHAEAHPAHLAEAIAEALAAPAHEEP